MSVNYCVFCRTGYEHRVAFNLRWLGFDPLVAMANRILFVNGKETIERRTLFPGYVFFRTSALEPAGRISVSSIDHVIRLLNYKDDDFALRGRDSEFVNWLWERGGVLDVSHAYREGDRIRFLDGPLKDLEGRIALVNMKRKSVAVQLNGNSLMGRIWCSVEIVENVEHPVYTWGSTAN